VSCELGDGTKAGDAAIWLLRNRIFTKIAKFHKLFIIFYCFFTIYSRYLKRVISKRDGCEYLKQEPSIDGSLELI
jgi:hypothetical protein